MSDLVVDASVAVKWLVPERHADAAIRVLSPDYSLLAPDLIWAEVGNTLWKKWRRGEIREEEASRLLSDFRRFPLRIYASHALLDLAWNVATRYGRSFYDSLYLALADHTGCQLVTADRTFYRHLERSGLRRRLVWIEDLP